MHVNTRRWNFVVARKNSRFSSGAQTDFFSHLIRWKYSKCFCFRQQPFYNETKQGLGTEAESISKNIEVQFERKV